MPRITLTDFERIVLINQLELRKAVSKSRDFDEAITILSNGYEIFYDQAVGGIYEPMRPDDGKFVLDVLDMFRAIDNFITRHPEDKEISEMRGTRFAGFDGNNETEYMAFTRFLIEKQRKFQEQVPNAAQTDTFNSHLQMIPRYRQQLAVWKAAKEKHDLARDEVIAIAKADG